MTPSELRAAAELLRQSHPTDIFNDPVPGYEDAADLLASHILATVLDDERAAFEAWAKREGYDVTADIGGAYTFETATAWKTWQAALGIEVTQ